MPAPSSTGGKLAGFPLWVWGVAGFGAIAVGLFLLPRSSTSSSTAAGGTSPISHYESMPFIYVMVADHDPVPSPPPPSTSPPNPPPFQNGDPFGPPIRKQ